MDEKLVVVVPGFADREKDTCLNRLIQGLNRFAVLRGSSVQVVEVPAAHGLNDYLFEDSDGRKILLSFKETFWSDLAQPLSEKSPLEKFIGGITILLFWTVSRRVLKVVWSNRYMFISSVLSVLILIVWYYGAVAAALTAIGSSEGMNPIVNALPPSVSKALSELGSKLAGWQVWISASALMALLPVNLIVDVAHSTKRYFMNDDDMAGKLQARIALDVNDAKKKNYTGIIVIAHSFGAVAAVEALAAFRSKVPIHLITAGSPLAITCARSPALERSVQSLLNNQSVARWSDLYSNEDWMCCAPPVIDNSPRFKAYPLTFRMGFFHRLTSKVHMTYFDCDILYELILTLNVSARAAIEQPITCEASGRE